MKKEITAINTGLLAYTFSELGDNLTNNYRDLKLDVKHTYIPFGKNAQQVK